MINRAMLLGYLGSDPEIRNTQGGARWATFRVATSESWRDKDSGERKSKTDWHTIVVWNDKLIEIAEKYLRKGTLVYVEGKLETRKWQDRNGTDHYSTEVVLKWDGKITLMPRGSDKGGDGRDDDNDAEAREEKARRDYAAPPAHSQNELDDEIPFAPEWR